MSSVMTKKGLALLAKAQAGTKINFTKVKFGDGKITTGKLEDLNDLINPVKSNKITSVDNVGAGKVRIRVICDNKDLAKDLVLREIGLFATDPDVGEILYCIYNAGESASILPKDSAVVVEKTIDIVTIISNASNVTATIADDLVWTSVYDFNDHKTKTVLDHPDNSVTDAKIGNRTINDTVVANKDPGTITNLLSKLGNMVKQITGKTNWYTAPAITLQALSDLIISVASPNKLLKLDNSGKLPASVTGNALGASNDGGGNNIVDTYMTKNDSFKYYHNTLSSKGRVWTCKEFASLQQGTYMCDNRVNAKTEFAIPTNLSGEALTLFNLIVFSIGNTNTARMVAEIHFRRGETWRYNRHIDTESNMSSDMWDRIATVDMFKGYSLINHTHNYAGSDSAGGKADSAKKADSATNVNGGSVNATTGNFSKNINFSNYDIGVSFKDAHAVRYGTGKELVLSGENGIYLRPLGSTASQVQVYIDTSGGVTANKFIGNLQGTANNADTLNAIEYTGKNANDINVTGFYKGYSIANSPINGGVTIFHMQYSDVFKVQYASPVETAFSYIYVRHFKNGAWTRWQEQSCRSNTLNSEELFRGDWNNLTQAGMYSIVEFKDSFNYPTGAYSYGTLIVFNGNRKDQGDAGIGQLYIPHDTDSSSMYFRGGYGGTKGWKVWNRIAKFSDLPSLVSTSTAGLCPKRNGVAGTYLNGQGQWTTPPNTVYTHPNTHPASMITGLTDFVKSQFSQSFDQYGWCKLPNGMIFQWGMVSIAHATQTTITFPISFPRKCIGMSFMSQTANNAGAQTVTYVSPPTATQANVIHQNGSTGYNSNTAYWQAIGY